MKDCIHDFIEAWKQYDQAVPGHNIIIWGNRFKDAGYYSAEYHGPGRDWPEVHTWCETQFGRRHYAWTGNEFWFETDQDVILFALRWL